MTNTRDERGSSAVEYGLLVAAIAAVLATTLFAIGGLVRDAFEHVGNTIACNTGTQRYATPSESLSCEPAASSEQPAPGHE